MLSSCKKMIKSGNKMFAQFDKNKQDELNQRKSNNKTNGGKC